MSNNLEIYAIYMKNTRILDVLQINRKKHKKTVCKFYVINCIYSWYYTNSKFLQLITFRTDVSSMVNISKWLIRVVLFDRLRIKISPPHNSYVAGISTTVDLGHYCQEDVTQFYSHDFVFLSIMRSGSRHKSVESCVSSLWQQFCSGKSPK